jgi:hypothetical protein
LTSHVQPFTDSEENISGHEQLKNAAVSLNKVSRYNALQ